MNAPSAPSSSRFDRRAARASAPSAPSSHRFDRQAARASAPSGPSRYEVFGPSPNTSYLGVVVALLVVLIAPAAALAAPPANDAPSAPADFEAVTAANGMPDERQGIAELAEATQDPGVPPCLGAGSFARTVWFRVPAADAPREIAVEATGRTSGVLDVAAFVQPPGGANTGEPNACSGVGSGGADASEDPSSGVQLRVPGGRTVLVQVGRRGPAGSADDERALLSLATRDLPPTPAPPGDRADPTTPELPAGPPQAVALAGATTTEEEPAQPSCPSLGGVWRRHVPAAGGPLTVIATGELVGAVTVFAGDRPTGDNAVGCENRERTSGEVAVAAPSARAGVPLWIRLGTDRPPAGATGTVRVVAGNRAPRACAATAGFRSVSVRPQPGRPSRVRFAFSRTAATPVRVDVFQQSIGRRVTGERLVARFTRRGGFTWNGRANRRGRRVTDGYLFARLRTARPGGGTDVRRVVLRRTRGRYAVRPDFYRAEGCGLVRSYKLSRPVFGGRTNRALQVAYRLATDARVTVEVLRGGRVVRRLAARTDRPNRTYRLRFSADRRRRGDYAVRLTVRAGTQTIRTVLVSRRL